MNENTNPEEARPEEKKIPEKAEQETSIPEAGAKPAPEASGPVSEAAPEPKASGPMPEADTPEPETPCSEPESQEESRAGSSFCAAMGKCSGNTYRALSENSDRLTKCLGGAAKAIADEAHMIAMRLGNLFKTVKKDTQLTHWELKRRDDFARLGEELYRRKEAELEKTETDEEFKAILAQIREDEERIHDIEDEKTVQRRKMRDESTFGHATTQLKNPDPRIRRAALRILMRLGRTEAIAKITPLLKDGDAEVRAKAGEAIRSLSASEEAAAPISENVEEEDHEQSGKRTEPAGEQGAEQPAAENGGQQADHGHKQSKKERRNQH